MRLGLADCPICGRGVLVQLGDGEMLVRCLRCRATPVTLALVAAIGRHFGPVRGRAVYELGSRGALVRHLRRSGAKLTLSEYFDDVAPGQWRNGVRCEDVQSLSFVDSAFDLVTSTEVLEHVPDDARAFAEIRRVLAPGGMTIFSVPLSGRDETIERARATPEGIVHLLPPEYHGDRLRGRRAVLAYRTYGRDIVARVLAAGFRRAFLDTADEHAWLGHGRQIVVAMR
jgi:SAM-dependent methyltransferase